MTVHRYIYIYTLLKTHFNHISDPDEQIIQVKNLLLIQQQSVKTKNFNPLRAGFKNHTEIKKKTEITE